MSCLICLTALYEKQESCLFLKGHVFNCLADELLSSFDHLKSLSTSKGNNNLLQKRHRRIDKFLKSPYTVVKVGQVVKVKVLEVDEKGSTLPLQWGWRITRLKTPGGSKPEQGRDRKRLLSEVQQKRKQELKADTAMIAAFARLRR